MMLSEPRSNRVKMTSYFPIPDALTPREREIATLASAGLSNRQIARQSSLVEGTVKIHLHNIYGKLGVKNRTALAALLNGYRLDWTNSSMARPTLSPTSLGIATLASAGLSNKQIARQSSLVEGTVKIHLHNIYRKLGVKNRTALAALLNGYRLDWTNSSMAGPTLSPKSLGVATLASAGLSNKQIARQSSLVEGTVKIHLHNIYRKLGVKNRTALAALLNGYRL